MSAVPDRQELHRLIDQMNPGQVRRLLRLAKSDSSIADAGDEETGPRAVIRAAPPMAEPEPGGDALHRFQSFVGIIGSGQGDLSERHEEIIRAGLTRRDGLNSRPA